jgi:hypothetical protein
MLIAATIHQACIPFAAHHNDLQMLLAIVLGIHIPLLQRSKRRLPASQMDMPPEMPILVEFLFQIIPSNTADYSNEYSVENTKMNVQNGSYQASFLHIREGGYHPARCAHSLLQIKRKNRARRSTII